MWGKERKIHITGEVFKGDFMSSSIVKQYNSWFPQVWCSFVVRRKSQPAPNRETRSFNIAKEKIKCFLLIWKYKSRSTDWYSEHIFRRGNLIAARWMMALLQHTPVHKNFLSPKSELRQIWSACFVHRDSTSYIHRHNQERQSNPAIRPNQREDF